MTICHIIVLFINKIVIFFNLNKGFEMAIIIKNTESLFEKFENTIGNWAEKFF